MSSIVDATLLKMAEAEILEEAKRAAVRHSTLGITGWRAPPKANKLFLANTLVQTLASNKLLARKQQSGSSAKKKNPSSRKFLQGKTVKGSNDFVFKKPDKSQKSDLKHCSGDCEKRKLKIGKDSKKLNHVKSESKLKEIKK